MEAEPLAWLQEDTELFARAQGDECEESHKHLNSISKRKVLTRFSHQFLARVASQLDLKLLFRFQSLSQSTYAAGLEATALHNINLHLPRLNRLLINYKKVQSASIISLDVEPKQPIGVLFYRYWVELRSLSFIFQRCDIFMDFITSSLAKGKADTEPEKGFPKLQELSISVYTPGMGKSQSPLSVFPAIYAENIKKLTYNCKFEHSVPSALQRFGNLEELVYYGPNEYNFRLINMPTFQKIKTLIIHKSFLNPVEIFGLLRSNKNIENLSIYTIALEAPQNDDFSLISICSELEREEKGVYDEKSDQYKQAFRKKYRLNPYKTITNLRNIAIRTACPVPLDIVILVTACSPHLKTLSISSSVFISRHFIRETRFLSILQSNFTCHSDLSSDLLLDPATPMKQATNTPDLPLVGCVQQNSTVSRDTELDSKMSGIKAAGILATTDHSSPYSGVEPMLDQAEKYAAATPPILSSVTTATTCTNNAHGTNSSVSTADTESMEARVKIAPEEQGDMSKDDLRAITLASYLPIHLADDLEQIKTECYYSDESSNESIPSALLSKNDEDVKCNFYIHVCEPHHPTTFCSAPYWSVSITDYTDGPQSSNFSFQSSAYLKGISFQHSYLDRPDSRPHTGMDDYHGKHYDNYHMRQRYGSSASGNVLQDDFSDSDSDSNSSGLDGTDSSSGSLSSDGGYSQSSSDDEKISGKRKQSSSGNTAAWRGVPYHVPSDKGAVPDDDDDAYYEDLHHRGKHGYHNMMNQRSRPLSKASKYYLGTQQQSSRKKENSLLKLYMFPESVFGQNEWPVPVNKHSLSKDVPQDSQLHVPSSRNRDKRSVKSVQRPSSVGRRYNTSGRAIRGFQDAHLYKGYNDTYSPSPTKASLGGAKVRTHARAYSLLSEYLEQDPFNLPGVRTDQPLLDYAPSSTLSDAITYPSAPCIAGVVESSKELSPGRYLYALASNYLVDHPSSYQSGNHANQLTQLEANYIDNESKDNLKAVIPSPDASHQLHHPRQQGYLHSSIPQHEPTALTANELAANDSPIKTLTIPHADETCAVSIIEEHTPVHNSPGSNVQISVENSPSPPPGASPTNSMGWSDWQLSFNPSKTTDASNIYFGRHVAAVTGAIIKTNTISSLRQTLDLFASHPQGGPGDDGGAKATETELEVISEAMPGPESDLLSMLKMQNRPEGLNTISIIQTQAQAQARTKGSFTINGSTATPKNPLHNTIDALGASGSTGDESQAIQADVHEALTNTSLIAIPGTSIAEPSTAPSGQLTDASMKEEKAREANDGVEEMVMPTVLPFRTTSAPTILVREAYRADHVSLNYQKRYVTKYFNSYRDAWNTLANNFTWHGENNILKGEVYKRLARQRATLMRRHYESTYMDLACDAGYLSRDAIGKDPSQPFVRRFLQLTKIKGPKQCKTNHLWSCYRMISPVYDDSKCTIRDMQNEVFQAKMNVQLEAIEPFFNPNIRGKPFYETKTANAGYIEKIILTRNKLRTSITVVNSAQSGRKDPSTDTREGKILTESATDLVAKAAASPNIVSLLVPERDGRGKGGSTSKRNTIKISKRHLQGSSVDQLLGINMRQTKKSKLQAIAGAATNALAIASQVTGILNLKGASVDATSSQIPIAQDSADGDGGHSPSLIGSNVERDEEQKKAIEQKNMLQLLDIFRKDIKLIDMHEVHDVYCLPFNKNLVVKTNQMLYFDMGINPHVDQIIGQVITDDMLEQGEEKHTQKVGEVFEEFNQTKNNTLFCNILLVTTLAKQIKEIHMPAIHLSVDDIILMATRFESLTVLEIGSLPTPSSDFRSALSRSDKSEQQTLEQKPRGKSDGGNHLLAMGLSSGSEAAATMKMPFGFPASSIVFSSVTELFLRNGYMVDILLLLQIFPKLKHLELENCIILNTVTNELAFCSSAEFRKQFVLEELTVIGSLKTDRMTLRNIMLLLRDSLTSVYLNMTRMPLHNIWRNNVVYMPKLCHLTLQSAIYDETTEIDEYLSRFPKLANYGRCSLALLDLLAVIACYTHLESLSFSQLHTFDYGGVHEAVSSALILRIIDHLSESDGIHRLRCLRTMALRGASEGDVEVFLQTMSKICDMSTLARVSLELLFWNGDILRPSSLQELGIFSQKCAISMMVDKTQ